MNDALYTLLTAGFIFVAAQVTVYLLRRSATKVEAKKAKVYDLDEYLKDPEFAFSYKQWQDVVKRVQKPNKHKE